MDKQPSPDKKDEVGGLPAAEVLKPRDDEDKPEKKAEASVSHEPANGQHKDDNHTRRHRTYRPSHKATFIGLAVVVAILAINAGVIAFVIKGQAKSGQNNQEKVTISQSALDKLGVNRSAVGDVGTELIVGPDTQFNGTVKMGKDVSIAGQLNLSSTLSASNASLTQLKAGDTSLQKLNVNGDGTLSNLNLRQDLLVTGVARLQGAVTISQLLTVNNSANISGNLTVGGALSSSSLSARSIISTSTLTIAGHVITGGSAPSVSAGSGVGSNGTVSISGDDSAGTVAVNIGVGSSGGTLAYVSFSSRYSSTPHVVMTPVGCAGNFYISSLNTAGFSIAVSGTPGPGGCAFDYQSEQ